MFRKRTDISPRRWLYVRVTIKVREFHGAALLAFEAAERGWGAILGKELDRLPPEKYPRGVLLEKGLMPGRAQVIEALRLEGHRIAGLSEEGLIYYSVEEYSRRHHDREAFALLDTYFSWGRNQTSDLVDTLGCDPAKIVMAGNPRFDLHRPELRDVFSDRVDEIRARYGRYILINTKFSKFNTHSDFDQKLDAAWKKGKVKSSEHEAEMRGLREFHRIGFEGFAEMIRALSRRYPGHTIVVRPHPSENHDVWREKAAGLPNVEIEFDGNVAEWILGSEVMIHNNCTTGVEAYLLGKPAISYRPFRDERFDMFLPNALSAEAFDQEEVDALVDAALGGAPAANGKEPAKQAEIARRYLANAEGPLSIERMMDALDSMDLPRAVMSVSSDGFGDLSGAVWRGLRRVRRALHGGHTAARLRYKKQIFDGLGKDEVDEFLCAVQRVTGRFRGLQVTALEKDILCVHK